MVWKSWKKKKVRRKKHWDEALVDEIEISIDSFLVSSLRVFGLSFAAGHGYRISDPRDVHGPQKRPRCWSRAGRAPTAFFRDLAARFCRCGFQSSRKRARTGRWPATPLSSSWKDAARERREQNGSPFLSARKLAKPSTSSASVLKRGRQKKVRRRRKKNFFRAERETKSLFFRFSPLFSLPLYAPGPTRRGSTHHRRRLHENGPRRHPLHRTLSLSFFFPSPPSPHRRLSSNGPKQQNVDFCRWRSRPALARRLLRFAAPRRRRRRFPRGDRSDEGRRPQGVYRPRGGVESQRLLGESDAGKRLGS